MALLGVGLVPASKITGPGMHWRRQWAEGALELPTAAELPQDGIQVFFPEAIGIKTSLQTSVQIPGLGFKRPG